MAKPLLLIIAAIPVFLAIMIAAPMIINPQVPFSATNADDKISFEFTKQHLQKSSDIVDRITPQKTEVLTISNDGDVRYLVTANDVNQPEKTLTLTKDDVKKLTALIKETGFMKIPVDTIQPNEDVTEYDRFTLKITLNGETKQIRWAEQNTTSSLIPPIILEIESNLENILQKTQQN